MSDTARSDLTTALLVLLGIVVLFPLLMMGFGGVGMMGYGMGFDHMMSGTYGLGVLGIVVQLGLILVFLGGGYLLARRLLDQREAHDAALELRRAYARGDLTDEEYETRREKLRKE